MVRSLILYGEALLDDKDRIKFLKKEEAIMFLYRLWTSSLIFLLLVIVLRSISTSIFFRFCHLFLLLWSRGFPKKTWQNVSITKNKWVFYKCFDCWKKLYTSWSSFGGFKEDQTLHEHSSGKKLQREGLLAITPQQKRNACHNTIKPGLPYNRNETILTGLQKLFLRGTLF